MCHSILHHDMKQQMLFKKNYCMYRKGTERYNRSKSFSDASNSSDIKEEIIKQINTLKPFDMEPRNATK